MRLAAQALGHKRLADYDVRRGNQLGEHWRGGGMHFACAVGCEGIVVSVNLGGPEHVRIVFGAVDGIQESARLLLGSFNQGRERGDVLIGLTFLSGAP